MPALLFPGIRYDPREPPPPGLGGPGFGGVNFNVMPQPPMDGFGGHRFRPRNMRMNPAPHHQPWLEQDDSDDASDDDDMNFNRYRRPEPAWRPREAPRIPLRPQEPHQPQEAFLAPLSTSVTVQIVHDTAKFTVVHLFSNQTTHIKQGVYQFPLPHEATVTDFCCRIGQNRIVRGKVKEKEEARRAFQEAARRGRAGGIVEQETAEIFTTTLANIPADTKMRAELTFTLLLKHRKSRDQEIFTLTIPTYIAPRYGELPPGIRANYQHNNVLGLDIDILTAEELLSVNSDTHEIVFTRGNGQRPCQTWTDFVVRRDEQAANLKSGTVQLEQGRTSLDKDLVITMATASSNEGGEPQACLEIHPTFAHHKALMLTVPPEFMLAAESSSHDGEIIFVADRSGSMSDKIESLKSAMMFFINGIPINRPFNIWCFGSRSVSMWPRSRPFGEATKQEAINYVRNEFRSNLGGTDLLPALENIHNARGGYHSMDIIVLTDGELWSPNETIDFIKEKWTISEGMIRFFSLGIGHAVSHELVEGIAKAGGGYAEVIAEASGGGWEDRVVAVLKAATTGHIGPLHIEVEWKNNDAPENLAAAKFKMSPSEISAISPFIRNRVFWLFDSGNPTAEIDAIVLKARGAHGADITKRVTPKSLAMADSLIHKLAVRSMLGDLERKESWLHRNYNPRDYDSAARVDLLARDAAIELGCKWSLVSQWTSIYAVEEEDVQDPIDGMDLDIQLPAAEDGIENALLYPRGTGNVNADRLIGASEDAEDANSDSDDSVDTTAAGRGDSNNDSDDDSDNDNGGGFGGHAAGASGGNDDEADSHGRDNDSSEHGGNNSSIQNTPPSDNGLSHQLGGSSRGQLLGSGSPPSRPLSVSPDRFMLIDTGPQAEGWGTSASGSNTQHDALPLRPTSKGQLGKKRNLYLHSDTSKRYMREPPSRFSAQGSASSSSGWKASLQKTSRSGGVATGRTDILSSSGLERSISSSQQIPIPVASAGMDERSTATLQGLFSQEHQYQSSQSASGLLDPDVPLTERAGEKSHISFDRIRERMQSSPSMAQSSGSQPPLSFGGISQGHIRSSSPTLSVNSRSSSPLSFGIMRSAVSGTSYPHEMASAGAHQYLPTVSLDPPMPTFSTSVESSSFTPLFSGQNYTPYNPPASTTLIQNTGSNTKSEDELAAEEFVRQLLIFQRSDGCFSFGSEESAKLVVGPSLLQMVLRVRRAGYNFDMVITLALSELLVMQFQICESLWVLMERKARDYVATVTSKPVEEKLRGEFRGYLQTLGSVVADVKRAKQANLSFVDLEVAPII